MTRPTRPAPPRLLGQIAAGSAATERSKKRSSARIRTCCQALRVRAKRPNSRPVKAIEMAPPAGLELATVGLEIRRLRPMRQEPGRATASRLAAAQPAGRRGERVVRRRGVRGLTGVQATGHAGFSGARKRFQVRDSCPARPCASLSESQRAGPSQVSVARRSSSSRLISIWAAGSASTTRLRPRALTVATPFTESPTTSIRASMR